MAMEVNPGGDAEPAPAAAEAPPKEEGPPAAEDDEPCATKMEQCTKRCVLMLEYYITDVASKFEGLDLISVPETGETAKDEFYKLATQPLFNEASYLYCGIQRCFTSLCSPVCGDRRDGINPDDLIKTECVKVRDQKDQFFKSQMKKPMIGKMVAMEPVCDSVCGRKTEGPWVEGGLPVEPASAFGAGLALVAVLLH